MKSATTVERAAGAHGSHEGCCHGQDKLDRSAFELVDRYVAEHPGGRDRLIPLLHALQQKVGYLPFELQEHVAHRLDLSPAEVFGVVSFYHFFTTTPKGRFPLKVCMGTACFVRHAQGLVDAVKSKLDLEVGQVTDDGLFGLEEVRCIGACSLAPAMMVGDEVYGNLEPRDVVKITRRLRKRAREEDAGGAGHDDA